MESGEGIESEFASCLPEIIEKWNPVKELKDPYSHPGWRCIRWWNPVKELKALPLPNVSSNRSKAYCGIR